MSDGRLDWIANYIWGIADDVLRDLYVRGKYRDVILPMTVLRRLDAVLEDTKPAVLAMRAQLDTAGVVAQDGPLQQGGRRTMDAARRRQANGARRRPGMLAGHPTLSAL